MKPIGYFVSVSEEHPDYQHLENIKTFEGDYLQNLTVNELWMRMYWCSFYVQTGQTFVGVQSNNLKVGFFRELTSAIAFDLIPFLHQVIKARMESNAN